MGKIVATTIATNVVENLILMSRKWRPVGVPFRNGRTGNDVIMWEKNL
jgi:hypothetical protein